MGGGILQGPRINNFIKTYHMRKLVSLQIKMKPLGEVTLTNIGGKKQKSIQKRKESSFMNWVIKKHSC